MNFRLRLLNHSSSVRSSSSPPGELPAQVMRMSIFPRESTVSETARSTSSGLLMPPAMGTTFWPVAPEISCAVCSSSSWPRAVITTVAPSSERTLAHSLPMPLLPPVINATFPSSPRSMLTPFSLSPTYLAVYLRRSGTALLFGFEHQLDLPRIHVQTSGDDQLLRASGDRQVAVLRI